MTLMDGIPMIIKGTTDDLDELERLYDNLNSYLESSINYPSWAKGIYPIRETAENGIQNDNLFVFKINHEIVGSIILNHEPENAYAQLTWGIEADYQDVIVIIRDTRMESWYQTFRS